MSQTPSRVQDLSPFTTAVHLHATTEAVVEHNVARLHACGQPIAAIKAVHTGPNAAKASSDDASGLDPTCWWTWDWSTVPWGLCKPSATRVERHLLTCLLL